MQVFEILLTREIIEELRSKVFSVKSLLGLCEDNLDEETLVIVFLTTKELAVELLLESGVAN